jgi:hypothetical protein
MKWKLLGYTLWLFAAVSLIGIPVNIYMAVTGKLGPELAAFTPILVLSLWRLLWAAILFFLGRFFIRKG